MKQCELLAIGWSLKSHQGSYQLAWITPGYGLKLDISPGELPAGMKNSWLWAEAWHPTGELPAGMNNSGYGLKLDISPGELSAGMKNSWLWAEAWHPTGELPAGVKQCELLIIRITSSQFALPHNTTLISAIYWVDSEPPCKFWQPLKVGIEHCATSSKTSRLSFAKCSQNGPPYPSRCRKKGSSIIRVGTYQCCFSLMFGLVVYF